MSSKVFISWRVCLWLTALCRQTSILSSVYTSPFLLSQMNDYFVLIYEFVLARFLSLINAHNIKPLVFAKYFDGTLNPWPRNLAWGHVFETLKLFYKSHRRMLSGKCCKRNLKKKKPFKLDSIFRINAVIHANNMKLVKLRFTLVSLLVCKFTLTQDVVGCEGFSEFKDFHEYHLSSVNVYANNLWINPSGYSLRRKRWRQTIHLRNEVQCQHLLCCCYKLKVYNKVLCELHHGYRSEKLFVLSGVFPLFGSLYF